MAREEISEETLEYIEEHWRMALTCADQGMESLRPLWPEFSAELAELDADNLRRALDEFELAYSSLLRAGRGIFGAERYAEMHDNNIRRKTHGGRERRDSSTGASPQPGPEGEEGAATSAPGDPELAD